MGFVHELEQLVDHRLQELPVVPEESGVLPDHIPGRTSRLMRHCPALTPQSQFIVPESCLTLLHEGACQSQALLAAGNEYVMSAAWNGLGASRGHDVGGNDGLVVLAARHLHQTQQVPDDRD